MDLTDIFPSDYASSRTRFRAVAARLGWSLHSYPIEATGPDGLELTIDAAISRGDDSGGCLVITGGLHGIEGFFGSAVQLLSMQRWAEDPGSEPPMRCAMIHGLNPYGYARLRRFDENNVDPNRNFLLDGEAFSGSPAGYAPLDALLNPKRPPREREPFLLRALMSVARHGMPALKQSIAAGQYDYPQGLFFGGSSPCQIGRILGSHLGDWLGDSRDIVHLDFHTGLGAWSTLKIILDREPDAELDAQLIEWFGKDSFEAGHANGVSYTMRGGFGEWCASRLKDRNYLYLCAEFGTYGPIRVVRALRAENMAHHWGIADSAIWRKVKADLRETFCPASARWRERVMSRSLRLVDRAISGLKSRGGRGIADGTDPAQKIRTAFDGRNDRRT